MKVTAKRQIWFCATLTMTIVAALVGVCGRVLASKTACADSSKQRIANSGQAHYADSSATVQYEGHTGTKQVPALFYAGIKLFNNARYTEARDVFNRAIAINPEIGDAHALLAACLAYIGRYQEAENEFVLAEKYGNSYTDFKLDRGFCAAALKNYKQAANCFDKYIASHPDDRMKIAKQSQAIVVNDFLGQPSGNYLPSACKRGAQRWNIGAGALRVYIDEKTAPDRQIAAVLKESFSQWSKSPSPIKFTFVNSAKNAQIRCSWTDNLTALGESEDITDELLGVTKLATLPHNKHVILAAKIMFFNLQNGSFRSREQILARSRSVCLHEIGHALGLGHSDYAFDTMYPIIAPYGLEFPITRRDLQTVSTLYLLNNRDANVYH